MMVFLKNWSALLLPFLFVMVVIGCREDLAVDNSDQNFPVTLQTERGGDAVTLRWEAANISTFEKYVVVRSTNPIPAGLRPVFSTTDFQIIFQSDDIDSLSFKDLSIPIVEELYYKLYVGFNDRFVESEAVKLSFDNLLVDGNGGVIRFVADSNWVILGDEFTGILKVMNFSTGEVKSQRSVPFVSSDNMCLDVVVENGKQVLYWWAGYNNFFKYSLPELNQLNFWSVPFSGFSVLVGSDVVYTTQYDYNQSFTPRRKNDMGVIKEHYRQDYYAHRTLAFLDKGSNLVVEASPYRVMVYNVNPITGNVTNTIEKTTNTFNVFFRDIPLSHNGQFFVPQFDGSVYDQGLNLVTNIPFQNNGYLDVDFSPDDQFLYAAYQDFTFGGSLIQKFRFPSMELIAERRFTNVFPRNLHAVQGGVIFVGSNVNGLNQVLVKKLEL